MTGPKAWTFYDLFRNQKAMLPKDILAVIPRPHLPLDFPGKFTNGQDGALEFLKFHMKIR